MKNSNTKCDSLRLENQICFPMYAASREIIKLYKPYLDGVGLTYTQYIAMMLLWEKEKMTSKEMGERLYLDSGTLTPMLKKLEQKGYICRKRSKSDERNLEISITELGKELREKAEDIPEQMAKCVKITRDEAVNLYGILYKILER